MLLLLLLFGTDRADGGACFTSVRMVMFSLEEIAGVLLLQERRYASQFLQTDQGQGEQD